MVENTPKYSMKGPENVLNEVVRFIFYFRLLVVIVIITATVCLGYKVFNTSESGEELKNLSVIVACGSILIGVFYSIINYEHNQIKFNTEAKRAKDTFSFSTATEWYSPSMVQHLKTTKELYTVNRHLIDDNRATEFSQILDANEHARAAINSIFNYLECISIGIEKGVLDDDFMKSYFKGICTQYNMDYGFYVDYRRSAQSNPRIWKNFTDMATRWGE